MLYLDLLGQWRWSYTHNITFQPSLIRIFLISPGIKAFTGLVGKYKLAVPIQLKLVLSFDSGTVTYSYAFVFAVPMLSLC